MRLSSCLTILSVLLAGETIVDAFPVNDRSLADPLIFGGTDAQPGDVPWQLSLQRRSGVDWSHLCGATLITSQHALTPAHVLDGMLASSLRIVAGLIRRSDMTGTQTTNVASYKMHEAYNSMNSANNIAIVTFAESLVLGSNIDVAQLPPDNVNDYTGTICVISGWGRTEAGIIPPDNLQMAEAPVISNGECVTLGASVESDDICIYNPASGVAACEDTGSPLSCPDVVGTVVAGFALGQACDPSSPSVYLRTSAYLSWIISNLP